MIPLLGVRRVTSADHGFIGKAVDLAIAAMEASNREIAIASTADVQDEAVRGFNTAARAYNGLADVAVQRAMHVPKPNSATLQSTPALAQSAEPGPRDVAFVTATQAGLERAVDLYRTEIAHGKDQLAVAFAKRMRPALVRDLDLVRVDIARMDHLRSAPTPTAPDPAPSASP